MKIKNIECCPHRRHDRHWSRRDTQMLVRCCVQFAGIVVAALVLVGAMEAACAALGCGA